MYLYNSYISILLCYCIQCNLDSILVKQDNTTVLLNFVLVLIIILCTYILCLDNFEVFVNYSSIFYKTSDKQSRQYIITSSVDFLFGND